MRAAPALELTAAPDRLWRLGVAALLLAGLTAVLAWAFLASSLPGGARAMAVAAGLPLTAWLLWCEVAAPPLCLRWDGQCWHWREAASPQAGACSGTLSVAADFGGWLLLRLKPHAGGWRRRGRWVALSRRAQPAHWHALRCAVYSPTPSAPRRGETPPFGPHER